MKPSLDTAIQLLHASTSGTLATNSAQLPGYPFATALPFAPDEHHCPVFLVSTLAEHTKNILADPRASLLVFSTADANVLAGTRMTMVGDVRPIEATQEWTTRYLRYQPDAAQYLSLGDFAFFRLVPRRVRYIAGFGEMGWIEEADWAGAAVLDLQQEAQCREHLMSALPAGVDMLGIDRYGCDIERDGLRVRLRFDHVANAATEIINEVKRVLGGL